MQPHEPAPAALRAAAGSPGQLRLGSRTWPVGKEPIVLGIVNVTPDSFSDGGAYFEPQRAVEHGLALRAAGADWLDIGGESTRPGARPVPTYDELQRVIPVLHSLAEQVDCPLSVDTYKSAVAREALQAGATIINDVTGLRDPAMVAVAAATNATCICMHMRGTPRTMHEQASYVDVLTDVYDYFLQRLTQLTRAGIEADRILIDPGIGFAKKKRHNLRLLAHLDFFASLGRPLLLGASRKRIIGDLTGRAESDRLAGTIATTILAYQQGVRCFRVHEPAPIKDALRITAVIQAEKD